MKGTQSHPVKSNSNRERPARILIVEDEAIVAFDFQQRFKRLGYAVAGLAHDGEEAIREARATRPDLVLMDINLGEGKSGIEAAMAIREHQDLPVIYGTANSDDDTVTAPGAKLVRAMN